MHLTWRSLVVCLSILVLVQTNGAAQIASPATEAAKDVLVAACGPSADYGADAATTHASAGVDENGEYVTAHPSPGTNAAAKERATLTCCRTYNTDHTQTADASSPNPMNVGDNGQLAGSYETSGCGVSCDAPRWQYRVDDSGTEFKTTHGSGANSSHHWGAPDASRATEYNYYQTPPDFQRCGPGTGLPPGPPTPQPGACSAPTLPGSIPAPVHAWASSLLCCATEILDDAVQTAGNGSSPVTVANETVNQIAECISLPCDINDPQSAVDQVLDCFPCMDLTNPNPLAACADPPCPPASVPLPGAVTGALGASPVGWVLTWLDECKDPCQLINGTGLAGGCDATAATPIVDAGGWHTCVLVGGNVDCYGSSSFGQDSDYLGGDAVAMEAGMDHTCIVDVAGDVDCWGKMSTGSYLGNAVNVAAGWDFSCALRSTGNVDCWGSPLWGPAVLAGYSGGDAVDVSAGEYHACVLTMIKTVHCWGDNFKGQNVVPAWIQGQVEQMESGDQHTCALTTSGSVGCWGTNNWGQANTYAPPPGITVREVSVDGYDAVGHSCALLSTGDVECWGENSWGQSNPFIGNAGTQVSAGGAHNCIVRATSDVRCWGANNHGQSDPWP